MQPRSELTVSSEARLRPKLTVKRSRPSIPPTWEHECGSHSTERKRNEINVSQTEHTFKKHHLSRAWTQKAEDDGCEVVSEFGTDLVMANGNTPLIKVLPMPSKE